MKKNKKEKIVKELEEFFTFMQKEVDKAPYSIRKEIGNYMFTFSMKSTKK